MVEAKQRAGFTLRKGRSRRLELARKNRSAAVGVFVFSARLAPEGLRPLSRYGNDLVVIWSGDPSDIRLEAALLVARAIAVQVNVGDEDLVEWDFPTINGAITYIESLLDGLDELVKSGSAVQKHGQKIQSTAAALKDQILEHLHTISTAVTAYNRSLEAGQD